MEQLRGRSVGRPPVAPRFSRLETLVIVVPTTPNMLHKLVVVLRHKLKFLLLQISGTFANTKRW